MDIEALSEAFIASLEQLRAILLQQTWLGFAHDWIAAADVSTIWTMVIVLLAPVVVGTAWLWPARREKSRRTDRRSADAPPVLRK
jgi:hypothetical protein